MASHVGLEIGKIMGWGGRVPKSVPMQASQTHIPCNSMQHVMRPHPRLDRVDPASLAAFHRLGKRLAQAFVNRRLEVQFLSPAPNNTSHDPAAFHCFIVLLRSQ